MSLQHKHIVALYDEAQGRSGLRRLRKLTRAHIHPSNWEKMRVKYAAQVLSGSVALVLTNKIAAGSTYMTATRDYVQNLQ